MESDSTSQFNRPPDGPWKWPHSWHVLRECPDAMDLINGQLRHWTNCAGVIADAFEEGGYPKLARSVRGMQGGYRSEPIERWEARRWFQVGENAIAEHFSGGIKLLARRSFDTEWKSIYIPAKNIYSYNVRLNNANEFLAWVDGELSMWRLDENQDWVSLKCNTAEPVHDVSIMPDGRILASFRGDRCQLWSTGDKGWVCEWSGAGGDLFYFGTIPDWHLYSVDYDSKIRLWSNRDGRGWHDIEASNKDIGKLFTNPQRASFFKGEVELRLGQMKDDIEFEYSTFLPDGRFIACNFYGIWILYNSKEHEWSKVSIISGEDSDRHIQVLPDGSLVFPENECFHLLTCNEDGSWSSRKFVGHASCVISIRLLSDGSLQSISDREVLRWGSEQHRPSTPLPHDIPPQRRSWWSRLRGKS
jgi:hypothetical protein